MIAVAGVMLFLLTLSIVSIILQVFLSKKDNKWLGLILPTITFSLSLLAVLGTPLFQGAITTTTTTINGVVVEQVQDNTATVIWSAVYYFLLFNTLTAVLLVIYASCRRGRTKQRSLEKMSVQDLV